MSNRIIGTGEVSALLLAGGRPMDEALLVRMMARAFDNLSGRKTAYIGTANGDNLLFFQAMKILLQKAGAESVQMVRLAGKKINLEKAKNTLSSSDVIFISGGEVEDGMNWLKLHGLIEFLSDLYANGKQFVGLSAGTIMMGKHWVHMPPGPNTEGAFLFDCLGIIPHTFDTHAEDEDWVELKTALTLMENGSRGYGIPSGGMVSADSKGSLECINLTQEKKDLLVYVNENGEIHLHER